jgi:hypothetical protein
VIFEKSKVLTKIRVFLINISFISGHCSTVTALHLPPISLSPQWSKKCIAWNYFLLQTKDNKIRYRLGRIIKYKGFEADLFTKRRKAWWLLGRRGGSMVACQTVVLQSRVRIQHLVRPQQTASLLEGCHPGWHLAVG